MPKQLAIILPVIIAIIISGCGNQSTPEDSGSNQPQQLPSDANLLVIGDVSDEPDQSTAFWQPLANYLAANLVDQGIDGGTVRVAPDLETMTRWLQSGVVDVYIDSSYPSLLVSRDSGSIPILRHGRGGVSEYHSVIFTLNSTGLTELDDLEGQLVAFDAPYSTSGFFLPAYFLIDNGYTLSEKSSNNAAVSEDEIGYVFSYQDINALQWLLSNRVNAVVTDSITFQEIPASTREQIVILAETESLPSQLVSVAADLNPNLRDALVEVMEAMTESEEGLAVLDQIDTSNFDTIPGGLEAFVTRTNQMFAVVEG
ncbi:MAG: phosphate/phosphite/phosphonate ABC transporter substrate-binding protein [Chloroflexi bacterium]|nr:phosphate/phosphite/phosphonate ABC transporter substrate-binding protein [Chloroflexota bacterium]